MDSAICILNSVNTLGKYTTLNIVAQSAGAVEYIHCISAEGQDSPNEYPGYDSKQSDSEVPVMLELWGMRSTPSLSSLSGPM